MVERDPRSVLPRPYWRLIPLIVLVLAVIAATTLGFVAKHSALHPPLALPTTAMTTAITGDEATCRPDRVAALDPGQQPWSPERRDASEALWKANAQDIDGFARGDDGWFFLGDAYLNNLSQAVGRQTVSEDDIAAFRDRYLGLQQQLADSGRQFAFMLAPAKWDVYLDELPQWLRELRGATTADILEARVPELHWIDPRDALRNRLADTYSPVNSHWTDYGGYVAWQYTAACLASTNDQYAKFTMPPVTDVIQIDDVAHNEFAGLGQVDSGTTWTVPEHPSPLPDYELTLGDGETHQVPWNRQAHMEEYPLRMQNEGAPSTDSVLIVGDSTFSALSPYAAQMFQDVHVVRHQVGEGPFPDIPSLAEQYDANLVLVIMTERELQVAWR